MAVSRQVLLSEEEKRQLKIKFNIAYCIGKQEVDTLKESLVVKLQAVHYLAVLIDGDSDIGM